MKVQYRAIKRECKITGRESYVIETKRGEYRDWNYDQHVGNETGLANFRVWADKRGWQFVTDSVNGPRNEFESSVLDDRYMKGEF